jgi:aldehyde:ferredoxin oxidoreductase
MVQSINDALGTELDPSFFRELGRETLKYEAQFNKDAGFTEVDDELPEFFYEEALYPSDQVARFHAAEVNASVARWWEQHQV